MSRRSISISAAKWNCCGGCGSLADENRYTVLVVTHELNLAAEFSDRIVLLHSGKVLRVADAPRKFTSANFWSRCSTRRSRSRSARAAGRA